MPTAFRLTVAIPFFLAACIGCASAQATLTAFKDRGSLLCGSSQGLRGFSMPDENGR